MHHSRGVTALLDGATVAGDWTERHEEGTPVGGIPIAAAAAAAAATMQQDRYAVGGTAHAIEVATVEPAVHVGVSFHTQFLASI